jgi:hypothetical protein
MLSSRGNRAEHRVAILSQHGQAVGLEHGGRDASRADGAIGENPGA